MSLDELQAENDELTKHLDELQALLQRAQPSDVEFVRIMAVSMHLKLRSLCSVVERSVLDAEKIAEGKDAVNLWRFARVQFILLHMKEKGAWQSITNFRQRLIDELLKVSEEGDTGYFSRMTIRKRLHMRHSSALVEGALNDLEKNLPGSGYKLEVLRVDFDEDGTVKAYRFLKEERPAASPVPSPASSSSSDASGG